MKKTVVRLIFPALVVLALGACRTVDAGRARVAAKANEYLDSGATRDSDEAVRMAREFYRQKFTQEGATRQREREMTSDISALQNQQRDLDRWSESRAPH